MTKKRIPRPRDPLALANFVRIHQTLRVTPAMAVGVTDKLWELEHMAALLGKQVPAKRGPYKKRAA
jgi:hypothetical protein